MLADVLAARPFPHCDVLLDYHAEPESLTIRCAVRHMRALVGGLFYPAIGFWRGTVEVIHDAGVVGWARSHTRSMNLGSVDRPFVVTS